MPKLFRPSFKLFKLERLLYTAHIPKLVFQPVSLVHCITQARPFSGRFKCNSSFSKLLKSCSLDFGRGCAAWNLNFGVKYMTGHPILAWITVNL